MHADDTRLADMRLAAQRVADHISNATRAEFLASRTLQAAVEREIEILGEAAGRLSDAFRAAHPEVPWARITRLRNFYAHAYARLDAREVWTTARRFVAHVARLIENPRATEGEETE